ncbi:MAG: HD-GYP domain-containing protein, partial [Vulcanimicrobiaceae bacterium]
AGFSSDEIPLFASLADDITLALHWLEAEDLRAQTEVRERARVGDLDAALEGALSALAIMFEKHDPYTGGHQKRVAQLTRLIAAELRLDDDRARGLFLAASVHDIGKISISAEILSKPTPLTPMEYAIVKEHPEIGYGIMSPIKFPWRIAEMVHQHHEFLDGSGYPRGLAGEDILFETRILTCADIVDAMTSFRPYRRSSGLDEAIEEVAKLAKSKLDSDIVAACVRVIERNEFQAAAAPPSDLSRMD